MDRLHNIFSERELFLSDCKEYISPQLIQGKAEVLEFEDYDKNTDKITVSTYYSR